MRLQILWWTSLNWLRLAGAVAVAVPVANRMATLKDHDADPVPGPKPFTISGADGAGEPASHVAPFDRPGFERAEQRPADTAKPCNRRDVV